MKMSEFIYTTYIKASPQKVWEAITDPKHTREYWVHENVSDYKVGSYWFHNSIKTPNATDIKGKILNSSPFSELSVSWYIPQNEDDLSKHSQVDYLIEESDGKTRLTVIHSKLRPDFEANIKRGWPLVLSSLKSYLEIGEGLIAA